MQRLGDYIKEYSARNKFDEEIPVYSVTNSNGFCRDYFGKEVASSNKRTYKIVPRNAFAYNPSRINVGSVDYQHYEDRVIVSPLYNVFTVDEKILPQYLYFYLKSPNTMKRIRTVASGSVRDNLKLSMLCEFPIQVPSINRQQNIIELLEKVQRIIDENNDELEKLDNLVKARFVEMFGTREKWNDANWKIASIDEIIEKPKSGEWGQKDESGRGIGVIRTTNFSDGGAVYFNSITTRDIPREKLITKGIKNGDILIEKSGGSDKKPVGRVVLYTGESNKYLNNNFTAILRINNNAEVNNIFLFTFLYINYWQGGTKVFESKTTGIHNLNLKEFLNKTKIALPDMSLQNRFATFVAQVDKSKFAVQKSLEKTQLLFDSLMQEYFG
jgi:hypothetical protein